MLITKAEVVTIAFNDRKVQDYKISDTLINAIEYEYIRGYLGKELYANVIADINKYALLITNYIKPVIAYFVKENIMRSMYIEPTERGINHLDSDHSTTISKGILTDTINDINRIANILLKKMTDYLEDLEFYGFVKKIDTDRKLIGGLLC